MHGNNSPDYSKLRKWIVKFTIALCVLLVCIYLYWLVFAPVVSRLFISRDCIYQGTEYYLNNSYLEFENGKDFQKFMQNLNISTKGIVIDFYYVDNHVEDNPIYGKMCDIYSVELELQPESFQKELSWVEENAVNRERKGDYMLYALPYDPTKDTYVQVIAFCNITYTARYIIITEFDSTDGIGNVFGMHTNLVWSTDPEA